MTTAARHLLQPAAVAPRQGREAIAALRYAASGWRVFPTGPDKAPLVPGGFKAATCDVAQVRRWWSRWPGAGIGWAVGPGFVVVDVDGPRGHGSLCELEATHGPLPATLMSETGGGGLHLIYRLPAGSGDVRQMVGLRDGIDTRVGGLGYIVLPPSQHASGLRYRWRERTRPVEAPVWLVGLLRAPVPAAAPTVAVPPLPSDPGRAQRYAFAALAGEAAAVAATPEGGRNHRLTAAWLRLTRDQDTAPYLSRDRVRAELTRAALAAGLGQREIARTLRDVVAA